MNKGKRIDSSIKTYREEVGKRVKKEREKFFKHCDISKEIEIKGKRLRKRNYEGLSLFEFGTETGIDEDTLYNIESGRAELKVEYLYKISKACKCDIGYLLGECDNRTYVETDIHKATGLSEEAIGVLIYLSRGLIDENNDNSAFDDMRRWDRAYLEIINNIIESWDPTVSEEDLTEDDILDGFSVFPINSMCSYLINVRKNRKYSEHKMFKDIYKIMTDNYKENLFKDSISEVKESFNVSKIYEQLQELGYTDEEIREAQIFFKDFSIADFNYFQNYKRFSRINIQDLFSSYLRSDFFEGRNNGK